MYYYPCKDQYDCQGVQEKGWLGLWDWFHGYIVKKQASEGCKKPLQMGPKAFWGAFPEFPFLMPHLTSPRSLYVWDIPMELLLGRCLINILPDFLGLHSCPCKASDKFIQLEWVGLEGNFATNLYQNLTFIERRVVNTKYQTLSQQTSSNWYFMSNLSFKIFSGFHLAEALEGFFLKFGKTVLKKFSLVLMHELCAQPLF